MRPQRKPYPSRKSDSMDHWLDTQGLYRKHTARDGSCLFRAVAEQLFYSQVFHIQVRRQVVNYMEVHSSHFKEIIEETFEEYCDRMRNPLQSGGKAEIEAIGNLYSREIVVHHKIGCSPLLTGLNFSEKIHLCFSDYNHYDSVYTKQHIENAGFCQALVYDALYSNVFKLTEVSFAVNEMLHSKNYPQLHVNHDLSDNKVAIGHSTNMRSFIEEGITPFPFKVAKALDVDIYRNIEFDSWSDNRKEIRLGLLGPPTDFHVGVKCLVNLEAVPMPYNAYIQSMAPNKGPVEVFVEELGEKRIVEFSQLHVAPIREVMGPPFVMFKPRGPAIWRRATTADSGDALRKGKLSRNRKPLMIAESCNLPVNDPHPGHNQNANMSMKFESYPNSQQLAMYMTSPGTIRQSSPMQINQSDAIAFTPPQYVTFVPFSGNSSPASSAGYFTGSPMPNNEIGPAKRELFKEINENSINYMAVKSVRPDCSDLPLEDMPTLRFFYNLGLEYYPLIHLHNRNKVEPDAYGNIIEPKSLEISGNDTAGVFHNSTNEINNNSNLQKTFAAGNEENTSRCRASAVEHSPPVTEADKPQYQVPMPVGSCYAVARMVPQSPTYPYPVVQQAMYSHMMPFYSMDTGYYPQPSYEYSVNSVMSHPGDASESTTLENQATFQFNSDLNQQSLDSNGVFPYGLHFNGTPTSFVFHHQSASSGMYTPPPLNGVPYSPPPTGIFTIPPPPINAVFSPPTPGSPTITVPPWMRNQPNQQGKQELPSQPVFSVIP